MSTPLEQWVESVARMTRPAQIQWCDGSEEEAARIEDQMVREGQTFPLNEKIVSELFPPPQRSERRGAHGKSNVYLHARSRGRRTNQQLDGPGRSKADPRRSVRWLDERPHDVRCPVHPGTGGFAAEPHRGRGHRQRLRRRQHAHHVPHGQSCAGPPGQFLGFRSGAAFPGRSESGPPLHRALPRRKIDLEHWFRLRRQRAAREKVFRLAHRELDGARTRLDGRAHAHSGIGIALRKSDLHGGGVSERLRQDQPVP